MAKKKKASDRLKACTDLAAAFTSSSENVMTLPYVQPSNLTYAVQGSNLYLTNGTFTVLEPVHYLKLSVPIDAYAGDFRNILVKDDKACPEMNLCRLHGQLVFRVGKRFLPFENAIEFILAKDWQTGSTS